MRKVILLFALIGLAAGAAPLAGAAENDPERGKVYVRNPNGSTTEIYILRGTAPKDQSSVTVPNEEPAAKKEEPPKTKKIRRGRRTYTVPAD